MLINSPDFYERADDFLEAIRTYNVKEMFLLREDVFLDVLSRIQLDPAVAKLIDTQAVVLLLMAKDKTEVDGLISYARMTIEKQEAQDGGQGDNRGCQPEG